MHLAIALGLVLGLVVGLTAAATSLRNRSSPVQVGETASPNGTTVTRSAQVARSLASFLR